jgi:hypothetical protein
VPSTTSGFVTTGLLTTWDVPTLYMVMLTGISVGGQPVGGVPTSVSAGGTMVDTGTVITRRRDAFPGGARGFRRAGALRSRPVATATRPSSGTCSNGAIRRILRWVHARRLLIDSSIRRVHARTEHQCSPA